MVVYLLNRERVPRSGMASARSLRAALKSLVWVWIPAVLFGLSGCASTAGTATARAGKDSLRATVPRPLAAREKGRVSDGAVAKVETGRLREEDLGLEPESSEAPSERILVPFELTASHPERAAALRLTEQARELLVGGTDTDRAVALLERAIALDSHTPYAYYFLGEAHFRLGAAERALGFLERAASLFDANPYWASRVWGLRGLIWESGGERERALDAYRRALALWPHNLTAVSGSARLGGEARR